jgi:hypothetical protein
MAQAGLRVECHLEAIPESGQWVSLKLGVQEMARKLLRKAEKNLP